MTDDIEVTFRPPDLLRRMTRYPEELAAEMERTMQQSILHVQGSIPDYPTQLPGTLYIRTHLLENSLGVGSTGKPDVFKVQRVGRGYEGVVGTNVEYARWVIGTRTQAAEMKRRNWWTMKDAAEKAAPGIKRLFGKSAERMVKWLAGRR